MGLASHGFVPSLLSHGYESKNLGLDVYTRLHVHIGCPGFATFSPERRNRSSLERARTGFFNLSPLFLSLSLMGLENVNACGNNESEILSRVLSNSK